MCRFVYTRQSKTACYLADWCWFVFKSLGDTDLLLDLLELLLLLELLACRNGFLQQTQQHSSTNIQIGRNKLTT
ncbi:hypothetical protein DPMN_178093 [Dreissena polymorpha]|uniref:Uncharacterized protein n=1 Tax=Dreissena polymorpha TaxID=45954 RepID=A0A9D4IL44_DREPO|nr:hypothetical protein DPMN_178093 [Dreissena polymorpha]